MGITQFSYDKLMGLLSGRDLKSMCIAELGNQWLFLNDGTPHGTVAKPRFAGMFAEHVSMDINGLDGSVQMDLRDMLPVPFRSRFDVVTNYGTLEHVHSPDARRQGLWQALFNMHLMCREGALLVHAIPKTGNWPGHGYNYCSMDTMQQLADAAGYTIVEICEYPAMNNSKDGWEVHAAMIAGSSEFPSLERFQAVRWYDE